MSTPDELHDEAERERTAEWQRLNTPPAPWWRSKSDAEKLRVLVGWTMVFTGIVAAAVVTNAIIALWAVIDTASKTSYF